MSQYSELMSKLGEISEQSKKWINDQKLHSLEVLNSFEKNFVVGKVKFPEANLKAITVEKQPLSNIIEAEDEGNKNDKQKNIENSDKGEQNPAAGLLKDLGTNFKMPDKPPSRASKKRNNTEVAHLEFERRPKRGASIQAVQAISQQVNLSLSHKLRRPEGNKENIPNSNDLVKVKQEKLSIVEPEAPIEDSLELVSIKTEPELMPPPQPKNKRGNKTTRTCSTRSTRSNTSAITADRTSTNSEADFELPKPDPPRPKRTRAKKKQQEQDPEPEEPPKEDSVADNPANPRPKRTKKKPRKYSDSQIEENCSATSSPIIKQSRKLRKPNPDTEPKQSDSRNTDASIRADSEGSGRNKKTTQSKEMQVNKLLNGHKSSNSSTHSDFEEETAKGKNKNDINKLSSESAKSDSRKQTSKRNLQKQLQKQQENEMLKEKDIQMQKEKELQMQKEKELQVQKERELQMQKEKELQMQKERDLLKEQELRAKEQIELREKEQRKRVQKERDLHREELRKEEERLENEMREEDIKAKALRDKQIREQVKKIEEIRERQKCEQEVIDKNVKEQEIRLRETEQTKIDELDKLLKEKEERENELLEKQLKLQQEIENQTSKAGPKRKKMFKDLEKLQKEKEELEMARTKIMDEKQGIEKAADETFVLDGCRLDGTVVLSADDGTPTPTVDKGARMDGTVVLSATVDNGARLDATVTLDKRPPSNATAMLSNGCDAMTDDSILTDDNEPGTPTSTPPTQPTSAVKEKVQQFEQLFSGKRITRTKSKLLAKNQENSKEHSSEEKVKAAVKPLPSSVLSTTKPRNNIVANGVKTFLASVNKQTAKAEEPRSRGKEDPLKKKQEILEAKLELQKRKREEKMAAAAEARERAQRMRRAQLEAAQREKEEKHANAGQGKLRRLQEAEERRLAQEKKMLEIEERRKAEEMARQLKFEEEQRKAEAARKRQQAEQEKCKREAAKLEREMQQAKLQYQEKERQRLALLKLQADQFHTPMKTRVVNRPAHPEARGNGYDMLVYRDSDDDDEGTPAHHKRRNVEWAQSKNKHHQLSLQMRVGAACVQRLFVARGQTPDLLQLFPAVDRRMMKRTSSAIWHTPPHQLPALLE